MMTNELLGIEGVPITGVWVRTGAPGNLEHGVRLLRSRNQRSLSVVNRRLRVKGSHSLRKSRVGPAGVDPDTVAEEGVENDLERSE